MFFSDGCAMMYGGGDLEMEAYSLVRRFVAAGVAMVGDVRANVGRCKRYVRVKVGDFEVMRR
jgi:hypothetical protein